MSPELRAAVRRVLPWLVAIVGVVVIAIASQVFIGSQGFGYDFRAYDLAARRIAAGQPLYLTDTIARYNAHAYADLYLYPPQLAMLLVPLAAFGSSTAVIVWYWLRVAALAIGCAAMPVKPWIRLTVFGVATLSFPVLYDLNLGNVSLVVFAVSALIWRLGPHPVAGVLAAVLATFRYPFVILGLAWLAMGRWRAVAAAVVTGFVLTALALPIVGIGGYSDYVTILRSLNDVSTGPDNLSVTASLTQAGVPPNVSALIGLLTIVATALFVIAVGRRRDAETATVVALTATLLAWPFFHPHYLVALLLPAAFLAERGRWWAVALPLLGWLPGPILPLVAAIAIVTPALPGIESRPSPVRPAAA
jgi:hypothetical protein